jgi:pyridinium-3,5-bisthiocarboxylic acid mononucleotide nickel chelatase
MQDVTRQAYFDCASGASGEMILGALVSAGLLEADLRDVVAPLEQEGAAFELTMRDVDKGPVAAIEVRIAGQPSSGLERLDEMLALVRGARLPPAVQSRVTRALTQLAAAAAKQAGERPQDLAFAGGSGVEGVVAAVAVIGSLHVLGVTEVFVSPVNLGMSNPVVSALLAGAPTYSDGSGVPLVTPLGAALLAELAVEWPASPPFAGGQIGHGAGRRDLPRPNVMRCFLGYGTIPAPLTRSGQSDA